MNDGGPAFPNDGGPGSEGMSLRDWLAGQALSGVKLTAKGPITDNDELHDMAKQIAIGAYAIADAMISERNKTSNQKGEQNET